MTDSNDDYVKILFKFHSDLLEEWTIETMWAEIVDKEKGLYKIDNIPFYASIASEDIVFAEYDYAEERLTYRKTIEYSGNSTVQVVMLDNSTATNDIGDIFNSLGCETEKFKEGYFVMNVPADIDYKLIKKELVELQDKGSIDYAEACLSEKHWY